MIHHNSVTDDTINRITIISVTDDTIIWLISVTGDTSEGYLIVSLVIH